MQAEMQMLLHGARRVTAGLRWERSGLGPQPSLGLGQERGPSEGEIMEPHSWDAIKNRTRGCWTLTSPPPFPPPLSPPPAITQTSGT